MIDDPQRPILGLSAVSGRIDELGCCDTMRVLTETLTTTSIYSRLLRRRQETLLG